MRRVCRWAIALALGLPVARSDPTGYGLAKTPQMGWNSWNQLGCDYDEAKIRAVADGLVATGMVASGYTYLILDDCWMDRNRTDTGCPPGVPTPCWQFDRQRFPSGGQALINYVNSKGLKFGLYSSAGPKTCQGLPASLGQCQKQLSY